MNEFMKWVAPVLLGAVVACAQDPGFRTAEPSLSARQSAVTSSIGSANPGAAVLTSMEVLDNNRPISSGDTISIRILEDRREALQQVVAV
ncbi:MAG: hypothetical protein ACOVS5_18300, partial [Oligoflexus sp.]